MFIRNFLSISAICMLAGASNGAHAEKNFPIGDYFSATENRCYGRTYSPSHLQSHPRQTVKNIVIGHFPTELSVDGEKIEFDPRSGELNGRVWVQLKGSDDVFEEWLICAIEEEDRTALSCYVECDGGGFKVKARSDGKLLIKNGKYGFRVVRNGETCSGEVDERDVHMIDKRFSDDGAFVLDRLPVNQCVAPR